MSTKKKVVVSTTSKPTQTIAQRARSQQSSASPVQTVLIFGRTNYMLMLVGLALIGLGLMLMTGGAMPDPNTWDESLIYSSRRILLGPVTILLGLVLQIVAIFKDPGMKSRTTDEMS